MPRATGISTILFALATIVAGGGPVHTAQTPTAVVRGRVLAADTSLPLRGAQVTLSVLPRTGMTARTTTDEQGRFEFANLTAGEYSLRGDKAGYVSWSYRQRRPTANQPTFALAAGEARNDVQLVMPRAGAVVAHVTDDLGGAMGRLNVQLHRIGFANGERVLTPAATANTDDAGDARLSGVLPGEYFLSVASDANGGVTMLNQSESGLRYARVTYYPGAATLAGAKRIVVSAAQDTLITLPLAAVSTAHLAGVIQSSDGTPVAGLSSISFASPGNAGARESFPIQPDGRFDWPHVIRGQYVITMGAGRRVFEFLRQPLTVEGDDTRLVITTTKGSTINGRLMADEGSLPPDFDPSVLSLAFLGGLSTSPRAAWNDGIFTMLEQAGSGVLRLGADAAREGWYLKSVTLRGTDVTDVPTDAARLTNADEVRLVITRVHTTVSGTVIDSRGGAVNDFTVVAFPEDRTLRLGRTRHVLAAQPDAQGRFTLSGLPPGRYAIAAVDWIERGEELDPDLLAELDARATALTLNDNERKTMVLRLVSR